MLAAAGSVLHGALRSPDDVRRCSSISGTSSGSCGVRFHMNATTRWGSLVVFTCVGPSIQTSVLGVFGDFNHNNELLRMLPFKRNASLGQVKAKGAGEGGDGWIAKNDAVVRSIPLVLGSVALIGVLLNRFLSGIAPIAEASSAQSRSDVLALALAATVLLQGLVWKSIQPRTVISVEMEGVECYSMAPTVQGTVARELQWVWEAVKSGTQSQALVVVYGAECVLQVGLAAESGDGDAVPVNATEFLSGTLCKGVRTSGKQIYLANLALYPGRFELPFLPSNTQAVIIQPLGDDGVLLVASDTIRGFTARDQAWISTIGEKLDNTLEKWAAFCDSTVGRQVKN